MVRNVALALALAFALPWATAASAQTASSGDATTASEARRLFEEGVALAKSDRWAEALWAFRRSRKLMPRSSTSYNIANALYRLDRPVEGLSELDAYEKMPSVRGDRAALVRGDTLRALLESAVAEARLAITPIDAEVYVDDRRSKGSGSDRVVRLNPGPHSIRITRDGYEAAKKELQVERGSRETYVIALKPLTPAPVAVEIPASAVELDTVEIAGAPSNAGGDDRKRFVKRPGFWVMIGVLAAAGVAAGVAVAVTRKDDAPECGTTGTCATANGLTVTSF
ncbi:MAG: PEGA domain-containing protein [Myxococcales bacterium]|nr:PEGA domain-containing protein [Myxococcales bacterium]